MISFSFPFLSWSFFPPMDTSTPSVPRIVLKDNSNYTSLSKHERITFNNKIILISSISYSHLWIKRRFGRYSDENHTLGSYTRPVQKMTLGPPSSTLQTKFIYSSKEANCLGQIVSSRGHIREKRIFSFNLPAEVHKEIKE